jgi:hypothetical protein
MAVTTLSPKTIEWALEHFQRFNDTDIFHKPFEFAAIYFGKDQFIKKFSSFDILQWKTRPFRRCLVPKQRYGFRLATQLDPVDTIFYFCLMMEAGENIEKARLSIDKKISFSYRFAPDNKDYLVFDKTIGYPEFQKYSGELAKKYSFVVLTDIADFYTRIYHHRLENALNSSLKSLPNHAKAIQGLMRNWNQSVSYGIPVGNIPSRLIADLVIDDVDRLLLSEGIVFTRFVDDYRIFCNSRQEAYKNLSKLANALYDTQHGLTLQAQKTKILPSDEFIKDVLETAEKKEIESLASRFREILSDLGLDNPYESFDINDLKPEEKERLKGLNLESLLEVQIPKEDFDIPMTKFLINRLGQLGRAAVVDKLLKNIDNLHPVLAEIIRYITEIGEGLSGGERERVGSLLLDKLQDSVLSNIEFNKMQIMSLFAGSSGWGNSDRLAKYYGMETGAFFRRAVILAIGKAGQDWWLRTKKFDIDQMSPWDKRAFLYATSCFPKDEKEHWFRTISKSRTDSLETYIIDWANKYPIA